MAKITGEELRSHVQGLTVNPQDGWIEVRAWVKNDYQKVKLYIVSEELDGTTHKFPLEKDFIGGR